MTGIQMDKKLKKKGGLHVMFASFFQFQVHVFVPEKSSEFTLCILCI